MSQEKKTHKRKVILRYLILAAAILVIAAVTVITVFAANDWFRTGPSIDNVLDNPKPDEPENPGKPDEPEKPTTTVTTFAMPVSSMNVTRAYDFLENKSLMGAYHFHEGIDIEASAGTSVMACLDGKIESIVRDHQLDGNKVTVLHNNGIKTVYTFIDVKSGLKEGDTVTRGQTIGTVAEPVGSEYLEGAHLHFEVLENGASVDPVSHLDIDEK